MASQTSDAVLYVIGVFVGGLIFVLLAWLLVDTGTRHGVNATRAEAIEAGVGRWAVDETTGVTRFEWRQCPEKQ